MRPSSGCKNALRGIYKKETLEDKVKNKLFINLHITTKCKI